MSYHAIEDLIEDSIRLVLASARQDMEKRRLVSALYGFQARFDTSDTVGQLREQLDEIGWNEDEPFTAIPILDLIANIVAEAEQADDSALIYHWLAVLIEALSEYEIAPNELAADASFTDLHASASATTLRSARQSLGRTKIRNAYLKLASWASVRPMAGSIRPDNIDHAYMLRWFADYASSDAKIIADYQKDLTGFSERADYVIRDLPALVAARWGYPLVSHIEEDGNEYWLFLINDDGDPTSDTPRLFMEVSYTLGLQCLSLALKIWSPTLSKWQGKDTDANSISRDDCHFGRGVIHFMPDAAVQADKLIHPIGAWKYRLKQSRKILEKTLDALHAAWSYADKVIAFHRVPLHERLNDKKQSAERFRAQWANEYGWFIREMDFHFAKASLAWESGGDPQKWVDAIADAQAKRMARFHQLPNGWAEGLEQIRRGPFYLSDYVYLG